MKHQVEALRRRRARPKNSEISDVFADLMEMGCGKSKVILDEFSEFAAAGERTDLFVVAPAGSYRNWFEDKGDSQLSELKTHLDPRLLGDMIVAPWVTGGGVERKRRLQKMLTVTDRPRALFMNAEALSTVGEAEAVAREFLSPGRALFAVDESTLMRNGGANRTEVIMRLAPLAPVRRIMTGLVTPKSPMDLFWQFYFLDWRILGFESYVAFRAHYAVVERVCFLPNPVIRAKLTSSMGFSKGKNNLSDGLLRKKLAACYGEKRKISPEMPRRQILDELMVAAEGMKREQMVEAILAMGSYIQAAPKIKSYRNLEELREKIAPYSYRVLKEDCLDLKKKIYLPRDVELTPEQKRMYQEIKLFAETELEGNYVNAKSVITRLLRLHQITCGHVRDDNGVVQDVKSNRIEQILEILGEHSGKAVIWATYDREIRKIVEALKKEYGPDSTAAYWGGNTKTRMDDEKRFLSNPSCRWMVSSQAAGGKGNTWVVADLVVYAANSYDLELRAQSEDRTHRKGQTKAVTYVDLVARGTVDEKIIKALRKKIDMATAITGENYREWLI
jgi:hypothetical protein